ncbi:MAG: PTS transporter subunit EIIC [Clostridiaceae bacterium]|nr:PTS transporter subunit EIIC [Clostridiaceae bacterium]
MMSIFSWISFRKKPSGEEARPLDLEPADHLSRYRRRLAQLGSIALLPLNVLTLASLMLILADTMQRMGLHGAAVLFESGQVLTRLIPLVLAVSLANSLIVHEKGLAVLTAALSSLTWLTTASASVGALSGSGEYALFNLGWLPGFAAGYLTVALYRVTERHIRAPRLAALVNPRTLVLWLQPLAVLGGFLSALAWLAARTGLLRLAQWIPEAGAQGLLVYGICNRLLLPLGLHHILDDALWQHWGQFTTQNGTLVTGDIARFLAGDPTAGRFGAGFYPLMLLVVPALLLAIFLASRPRSQGQPALLVLAAAAAALLGGLTDAADWLILLVSPFLYLFYALLAGLSLLLASQLQILHGFSFSAGLADFLSFWPLATRPVWLLVIGVVLAVIGFAVFMLMMRWFDWSSPSSGQEQASLIRRPRPVEQVEVMTEPASEEPVQEADP